VEDGAEAAPKNADQNGAEDSKEGESDEEEESGREKSKADLGFAGNKDTDNASDAPRAS